MSTWQQNEAASSGYSITGLGSLKKAHLMRMLVTRFGQRRSGIIWLMTVEFPYLITNRICAPLELCAEESDEWQGRTQRPKWGRQKSEWDSCLPFLSHLLAAGLRHIWFSSLRLVKTSSSSSRNDQVFVSGHLIMFSLPVMKAVTGVSALGGNGGLFIPLKAQHHTCFARSVICNCGISWEALEQSTLCSGRDPSQIKHVRQNQRKTPPKNSHSIKIRTL